jgi:hypothetical protein
LSIEAVPLGSVTPIFVGVQTSADHIYHLERVSPGRYLHTPKKQAPIEVQIEDALMRPLISGEEAKRYQEPRSSTYLLFPYADTVDPPALFTRAEMQKRFPQGWKYLCTHERELRAREKSKMDRDDGWWGYNYPKNIDKQRLKKLGVAQTVPEMRVFYDASGTFALNNVRVNGILVSDDTTAFFLMGVLNSRVVDFVFRRIAKPKEPRPSGAYFEANKQYIAPLPIPKVSDNDRDQIAKLSRDLRDLHSERYRTIDAIETRLGSPQLVADEKATKWFWADVADVAHWKRINTLD